MKISDLRCHILQPSGSWVWLPVTESAYYKTLNSKSSTFFDEYNKLLLKFTPAHNYNQEITYPEFIDLFNDITKSFDLTKEPKISVEDNKIKDGQHRLSILLYLYGDLTLKFDNNELSEILWAK